MHGLAHMTKDPLTLKLAAVVVGFRPDLAVLDCLLTTLLEEVDKVIFVDNGGGRRFLAEREALKCRVEYVDLESNLGLGHALNQGFRRAIDSGCRYVATFDQDSAPEAGMIKKLLQAHSALAASGMKCAAVGPRFFDRRECEKTYFPLYREQRGSITCYPSLDSESGVVDVDVLITSGMLVNAAVWQEGITYNAGLFVDYTDTDWCFRARDAGYKLFVCVDQEMGHALSDAPPIRLFGLNFLRYSPLRRYYYFRNTVYFVRQPYVSWAWKRRLLIGLAVRSVSNVFIDEHKWSGLKMMARGLVHGVTGRLGAYPRQ